MIELTENHEELGVEVEPMNLGWYPNRADVFGGCAFFTLQDASFQGRAITWAPDIGVTHQSPRKGRPAEIGWTEAKS